MTQKGEDPKFYTRYFWKMKWYEFKIWMNTPPEQDDLFFVNIRELWQAFQMCFGKENYKRK
jgi:hypothetical protein